MRRVVAAAALTAGLTLALTGCIPIVVGPVEVTQTPGTRPEGGSPRTELSVDCASGAADLAEPGSYQLGDCESVTIEGVDIAVRAGDVEELTIRGDRVDVDAGALGSVHVQGNENSVLGDSIDGATVRGDRNELQASGELGSLVLQGNDNIVQADPIGSIDQSGDRNQIGS